jgi:hypothetical protein
MEWLNYLFKVSACLVLFFAFYVAVLNKLTFFKTNRFYLLGTLFLSFAIPALQFTIVKERAKVPLIENQITVEDVKLAKQAFEVPLQVDSSQKPSDWFSLLLYAYASVALILLLLSTYRLIKLFKHLNKGVKKFNGLKIVAKTKGFTNCSFFNYVFVDQNNLTEAELSVLLRHEKVHAQQWHSADKILLMIVKAILWFNPIIYLYDKALEQAHEYEADELTSKDFGANNYANLLLRLAVKKSQMQLVHNFVKSPIKARIKMLFNAKSKNMKKLIYLLILPISMVLIWGLTVNIVYALPQSVVVNDMENANTSKEEEPSKLKSSRFQNKATAKLSKAIGKGMRSKEKVTMQRAIKSLPTVPLSNKSEINNIPIKIGHPTPAINGLLKISYMATDSTKISKTRGIVTLFGNAQMRFDGHVLSGDKIEFNTDSNVITAYNAAFIGLDQVPVKAKTISYHMLTKKKMINGVEVN